jgi:hypothetical protein
MDYTRFYRRMRRAAKHPTQQSFSVSSDGVTSGINTVRTIESISDPSTYMSDGVLPKMTDLQKDLVSEIFSDTADSWQSTLASSNAGKTARRRQEGNLFGLPAALNFLTKEVDVMYNQADSLPSWKYLDARGRSRLGEEVVEIANYSMKMEW